jgi:hypothetical protein
MRNELLRLSVHPLILQKPLVPAEMTELSPSGKRFARFPFDSLITHAEEITINLDQLLEKELILVRRVGGKEFPESGAPIFARPSSIVTEPKGRVFVCDNRQIQVFVLNAAGDFISSFGRKGRGPGEFCPPSEIIFCKNRLLVADGCLKIHEFDMNMQFINNYTLDSEIPLFSGFGCVGDILFLPYFPLPPQRTKIIQVYEIKDGQLRFITSFFDYFQLQKRYSSQSGAILSRNSTLVTTNGERFLAFGRPHEQHFCVLDLEARVACKYRIEGKTIERHLKRKMPDQAPDFAVLPNFRELNFDEEGNLYALVPGGIVVIRVSSRHELPYLYRFEPVVGNRSSFGGYNRFAVSKKNIFLLSSYSASLAIFKRVSQY